MSAYVVDLSCRLEISVYITQAVALCAIDGRSDAKNVFYPYRFHAVGKVFSEDI